MTYRENVQALCDELGLLNPIQERDVRIASLNFRLKNVLEGFGLNFEVAATDMNRAGRLFVQAKALGSTHLLLEPMRAEAERFFTAALWEDCTRKKRPLVFGVKTTDLVEIVYK